jgi:betaine-aldehyde dehydrogenase
VSRQETPWRSATHPHAHTQGHDVYEDEADALRIPNDSEFGLLGSLWTADVECGIEVARRVRTGTYGVNAPATMDIKNPFGGFKASGVGHECGPEGLAAYLEVQTIVLPPGYAPPAD